ncbi:hypothetical protein [Halorussus halophilus]|uniref:hypothetical protein n=1 Tax=Halorussus halophilus TaxID=2650975 RepID=UPI001787BE23|nr:hypothetical protein [Halorussus halophilus]
MYKAQISDGEQIECADYETDNTGATLYDEEGNFIAFVPYTHLLYVGRVTEDGQMVW